MRKQSIPRTYSALSTYRTVFLFITTFFLLSQAAGVLYGTVPAKERAALIALYNATDGDNWSSNYGWKAAPLESDGFGPIGSEDDWRGISVSGDHVTSIWLIDSNLTGSIPPELGNLGKLEKLSLFENQLTGSLPPELGNLGNLEKLYLHENQLTGSLPPELGNLGNLESLALSDNQLTVLPPELGNLGNLVELYLQNNQLTAIPPELGNLGNLVKLYLYNNQLTVLPPELGNLGNLVEFYLYNNQLTAIPPELGNLGKLVKLYLYNNQLTAIPPELGNLGKLEKLYLSYNQLTAIPPGLENLKNLKYLDLYNNQLTAIPPELGNLTSLGVLELGNNQLTAIPPELENLENLSDLRLSYNQLTVVPTELWNMENLYALHLSHNQLTGGIPPVLGNLSKLTTLYLSGNMLSGSIPMELMNLSSLLYLRIDHNALYTHDEDLKEFLSWKDRDWEETQTIAPADVSVAAAGFSAGLTWTPIQYTGDTGGYMVYYSNSPSGPWTYAGKAADKTAASYTVTGLDTNSTWYFMVKTQTEPHDDNANTVISDAGAVVFIGSGSAAPFGSMETPSGEAVVSGSIPVTGWALDDYGIESVKIYREENQDQVYIGDALFVPGARPDIEEAYPTYPNNHKAGWGYMLLTNFLPNGGNGTFKLTAVAVDLEGSHTTLGAKTITCDNENAVKPFGAIDTPAQGGTVSIKNYRNQGWVLTPRPNTIPRDGSTIHVYIDSVFRGRPVYDVSRIDIADLFPYYTNSGGAGAYFDFDTSAYPDGVHTIQWNVTDDAGNSEGIGSRYFTVKNTQGARSVEHGERAPVADVPVDYVSPVEVKKGYHREAVMRDILPDENGVRVIQIRPLERITIGLNTDHSPLNTQHSTPKNASPCQYTGYSMVGNQLRPLPVGSTLDAARGIFYWSPGVGFIGTYRLVFIETSDEATNLKYITVTIVPKSSAAELKKQEDE